MADTYFISVITSFISVYGLMILGALCATAGQILCGVAIYQDCKAIGRENGAAFGVLTALFGVIPAVVYVAVRHKTTQLCRCPSCGGQFKCTGYYVCPVCGGTLVPEQIVSPEAAQKSAGLAKKCFGWAVGLCTAGMLIVAASIAVLPSALYNFIMLMENA